MASLRVLFGFYYGCNQVSSEVVSVGGFWIFRFRVWGGQLISGFSMRGAEVSG